MNAIALIPADTLHKNPHALSLQMQECQRQWQAALETQDRQQLKALRAQLAAEGCQARNRLALPGMREQWLAWLQLRCSLIIPRSRF